MNISINRFNATLRESKGYFFIVLIMFCLGISFGLYTVKYMGASDKSDLMSYFSSFTNSIENESINYGSLLFEVIKKNIILIIPIIVFGMTFFGDPIILIIVLIKGFILSYTFSFITTTFEGKGVGLAIAAVIPQNLIYIPCIILLSVISVELSTEKFKERFFKSGKNKKNISSEVLYKYILIGLFFTLGIVIETYISPNLMKFVVKRFC